MTRDAGTQGGRRLGAAAVACLVAGWLGGCGYAAKETFPSEYQTVAVPIFENRTFYRGLEFDLTEALVKEIEQRTPYKVVAPGSAATVLEGTVTRVDQTLLSRSRQGGLPQQMEVTVAVDWVWKDQRTGQTLRDRRGFESAGRFAPQRPVGQTFDAAQHQAVERLAEDIVSTMQADW